MAEEEKNEETQENIEEKEEKETEEQPKSEVGEENKSEEVEEEQEEVSQEDLAAQWANMVEEGGEEGGETQEDLAAQWENMVEAKEEEKAGETQEEFDEKLSVLMDIPLEISVEIGSTSLPIEEVLKLNPNKIVEFDKDIDKPVDIKINGKLVAQGELYTVKNHFGVRITNIITLKERLKLLDDLS